MKLRMEKAIYGGASLARVAEGEGTDSGKAIFVPLTLPGELVEAAVVERHRGYLSGALRTVLEPSAARATPGCSYFPRCGGCQYQHASYSGQTEMKAGILREALTRAHVWAPDAISVVSGPAWEYRNRIRLHVSPGPEWRLCYREAGSHRNLPVDACPVAAPLLERAIPAVQAAAGRLGSAAEGFDEVELFCDAEERALLVSLFAPEAGRTQRVFAPFCEAIAQELPAFVGAALFVTRPDRPGARGVRRHAAARTDGHADPHGRSQEFRGRRDERENAAIAGQPWLTYAVAGDAYRVSAGSFFQVNRFLAPELLRLATAGRSGGVAWDLYAGVGLFARALSRSFRQVVAVEAAPYSCADLRLNLAGQGHRVAAVDTLQFLRGETRRGLKAPPDLVTVDPPRAGLGKEVCALLAAVAPEQIVYVSCDPATLARDLSLLQPSGYRAVEMTLIDLFPQTFHLETVAVLKRNRVGI